MTTGAAAAEGPPAIWSGKVHHQGKGPVRLYAQVWPNESVLATLAEGEEVPLIGVPVQMRGKSYTVRMDPNSIPSTHRDADGVDLQVTAVAADGTTDTYNETVVPGAARGGPWKRSHVATEALAEAHQAPGQSMKALRAPGNLVLTETPMSTLEESPSETEALAASEPVVVMSDGICGSYSAGTHVERVKISDVMPAVNDMKGRVTYSRSSSHEIGIGLKSSSGAVSAGGTKTVSTTETVVPAWVYSDKTAKTDWVYLDYIMTCSQQRQARPHRHDGGYYIPDRTRPSYKHCKWYGATESWSRVEHDAWTYAAGVSFWGLDLKAQVGYDTKATLEYSFPNKARWLCGNDATPPSAKLVAGYASAQ